MNINTVLVLREWEKDPGFQKSFMAGHISVWQDFVLNEETLCVADPCTGMATFCE